MNEILKKLDEVDRKTIERTLEMLKREEKIPHREHICEQLRWRIYGMADILLHHGKIDAEEYVVLATASKWGLE